MTAATVRRAGPADGPSLRALADATGRGADFLVREPGERPAWATDLAAFQAADSGALFVAEAAEGLVGWLAATRGSLARTRGVATLAVAVRDGWRGRGLGTRLFAAADAWAETQGLHRLDLTVAAGNTGAMALYRRLGFAAEGRLRGSLRIAGRFHDEVLMARLPGPADAPVWTTADVTTDVAADVTTGVALPAAAGPGAATLTVAPAGPGDAAAYLACDRAVRGESHFLLRGPGEGLGDEAHARRFLAGQAASGRAFTLAAWHGGTVVGMASAWSGALARTAHDWSLTLAVRRSHWGRGVGPRLLDATLELLRGVPRVSLWVLAHNARALALYRRRGFAVEAIARRGALIDGRFADHALLAVTGSGCTDGALRPEARGERS